jgi:transposase
MARKFRSRQEWVEIVEESLRPGATVAAVAATRGINRDQIYHWRKQYRDGLLKREEGQSNAGLLAVRVSRKRSIRANGVSRSAIEIEFPNNIKVRIAGATDPELIRAVLEGLPR